MTSSNAPILSGGMQAPTTGLKPSFNAIYKFTGQSLAAITRHEPWELKDVESEMLSEQTDQVVIEFFPQIGSRWGKLIALVVSLIGIFGMKWLSYEKEQVKRLKELKLDGEEPAEKENV